MDPITMAMIGSAGMSAASGLTGGLLGGQGGLSPSDMIMPSFDAQSDPGLAAQQYDALNQLGFGNVNAVPGPLAQLVNRINGMSLDEKTKRRALVSLADIAADRSESRPGRLTQVLTRLGLTRDDVASVVQQDAQFRDQQAKLAERLGVMNQDTVLNRAKAASAASHLLGEAGQYATGGQPSNFQQSLLNRLNRNIDDQEQAYLLRAQYGGFNPGYGLEQFQRARQDSELTALTQAVQAATALTGGLNQGLQAAQTSGGLNSGASMNALQIAAQQAQAANALAQQSSINRADSLANGLSGAAGGLVGGVLMGGLSGGGRMLTNPGGQTAGVGTERGFNLASWTPASGQMTSAGWVPPTWNQMIGVR